MSNKAKDVPRLSFWTIVGILDCIYRGICNPMAIMSKMGISCETFYRHVEFCFSNNLIRLDGELISKNDLPVKKYSLTDNAVFYSTQRGKQLLMKVTIE
mgnify:CR=1 FL=1